MEQSKAERQLLAEVKKRLADERKLHMKLQRERQQAVTRRGRVAARFQDRLIQRAFKAAGMDYADVRKRHAVERSYNERLIAAQKRATVLGARDVARQQASLIEFQRSQFQNLGKYLQPDLFVELTTANDIAILPVSSLGGPPSPTGHSSPGANDVRGTLDATAGYNDYRFDVVFVDFHFIWTSDRDGTLRASSQVFPNLSTWLSINPGCIGSPRAGVGLIAAFSVSQLDRNGQPQIASGTRGNVFDNHLFGTYSLGIVDGGPFSQPYALALPSPFAIVNGNPVIVTVSLTFRVEAIDGEAQIDFQTGDMKVVVPSVDLIAS